tara:strand:- start:354 stop:1370 length:1017 start_codon:yes stop_codon:yes gene_type:complete
MTRAKVISLGEALIDRLGPLGGDPAVDKPVIDCFGGAPANVACALSRLGVNVSFIGSIGNDSFGDQFKNLFTARGVNAIGLDQDNSLPTRVVLVRRDANGERTFGGFSGDKGFGFADQLISLKKIINNWSIISDQAQWLIIGTIPMASKTALEAFLWIIEKALNDGIKIALDLNWRPTFWRSGFSKSEGPSFEEINIIKPLLNKVSLLKLAKEEAQWFFNTSDPINISSMLLQRPSIVVTDGGNPVEWLLGKNSGKTNTIQLSSILDTTGAGDAFTAGLIYKILSVDLDKISCSKCEDIIKFSIGCGAFVCQGIGAIESQPYLEDVNQLLSSTIGGIS